MIFDKYKKMLTELFNKRVFNDNAPEEIIVPKFNMDTRPCRMPFECFEVYATGEVFPCCADMLRYPESAGNIEKQSFDEIWHGKMLTDLRKKMLKGDFSYCDRNTCCLYSPYNEIPSDYEKGPKILKISHDKECNYNCIMCRDKVKINTPEEFDKYEKIYLPKILEAAKNVEDITISGSGDPLFSRHSRHLIRELVKERPDLKIKLHTNGYFLDEETIYELGIENNIHGVSVSVNAATRSTYKKIHRKDAFNRVIKNLELMSEWKMQRRIWWITLNFVVTSMNYKEMPTFVKLAQDLDAMAYFSTYRPWRTSELYKEYYDIAIFEAYHKDYGKFVKILHNPVFKDEKHCSLEPTLLQIASL